MSKWWEMKSSLSGSISRKAHFKSMYSDTHIHTASMHTQSFFPYDWCGGKCDIESLLVLMISHQHSWKEGSEEMNLISCFPCFGKWAGSSLLKVPFSILLSTLCHGCIKVSRANTMITQVWSTVRVQQIYWQVFFAQWKGSNKADGGAFEFQRWQSGNTGFPGRAHTHKTGLMGVGLHSKKGYTERLSKT